MLVSQILENSILSKVRFLKIRHEKVLREMALISLPPQKFANPYTGIIDVSTKVELHPKVQ
jgi:hypothetical protein